MQEPEIQEGSGRTDKGRFAPGVSGNPRGRPRGIDPRAAFAVAKGESATVQTVVDVMAAMIVAAIEKFDTAAARIVLDRLCGPVRNEVDLTVDDPVGAEGRDRALKELAAILATAAARVR